MNMKEYYVEDRGIRWCFKNREKAEKKAEEINSKVTKEEFWKYFAPFYTGSTSEYRKIKGENLIAAIESNFKLIMKDNGLEGLSGYRLYSAEIRREKGEVYLIVDSQKIQKLGTPGNRYVSKIKIEGVENKDFENDEYKFEIIRR